MKKMCIMLAVALLLVLAGALPVAAEGPAGYSLEVRPDGGDVRLSTEQAHTGNASVRLATVDADDAAYVRFTFEQGQLKFKDITELSYWEYVESRENPLDVFVDIWLDFDGDGDADIDDYPGYMQAEPLYTVGAASLDTWTFIDAMSLKWSTYVGPKLPYSAPTLSELQNTTGNEWTNNVNFGDLDVLRIDVRAGYGGTWANFVGFADDVSINGYVESFEPDEVWVNDDWAGQAAGAIVDGHVFGYDAFTTIQEAIDAVVEGGTVHVADGTYTGNIIINKPLALLSVNGRDHTTIVGNQAGGELGTIVVAPNTDDVQIGDVDHGFTIIGIDGPPGLEKAAIYFQGNHSGAVVKGNDIKANGDAGLMTEYGLIISDFEISDNEFSGQTFAGDHPGIGKQFEDPNVPRQLVVMGAGASGSGTTNITFSNNLVTGTAGGYTSSNEPSGNTLVTIDADGSTITNNIFEGSTTGSGSSLRARRPDSTISGNNFSSAHLTSTNNHLFLQNRALNADPIAANTFDKGVYVASDIGGKVGLSIQGFVGAVPEGTTINVLPGTYNESLTINKADLTLKGANAEIPAGRCPGDRGPESVIEDGTIDIMATGVTVDGIKLVRTAADVPASKYGIHVIGTGATIVNSIFDGAAGVGNQIKGVLVHSPAAGGTNDVLVQACTMTEWATGIYLNDPNVVNIEGNLLEDNYVGMSSDDPADLVVISNSLIDNAYEGWGVKMNDQAKAEAHYNSFVGNGVAVSYYGSGATVDATENWWGSTDGPAASGQPNGVSANVNTSEWLSPEPVWCPLSVPVAPTLWVEASDSTTDLEGKADASVKLNPGAFEVFGFEFVLTYDKDLLTLGTVEAGSALSGLQPLAGELQSGYSWTVNDDTPGVIYVWVSLAGSISGFTEEDSELVNLSFTAALGGDCAKQTDLTLSNVILTQKVEGARIHPVNTAGDTVTVYKLVPVSGVVELQGRSSGKWNGVAVSLDGTDNGLFDYGTTTDSAGAWAAQVACGTYDVYVDMNAYLDAESKEATIVSAWERVVKLLGGNANENTPDKIFLDDVVAIANVIGTDDTSPGENLYPDINDDGTINILDLVLAGINYTLEGPKGF